MTTEEFKALPTESRIICELLIEILKELKNLNRLIDVEGGHA